jgi:hypothetical protein
MAESVQRWRYVANVVDGKVNVYFHSEDSCPSQMLHCRHWRTGRADALLTSVPTVLECPAPTELLTAKVL